jgi:hypothetical protein
LVQTYDPDGTPLDGRHGTHLERDESYLQADFGYAPSASQAAIGDLVWIDANGDGMQDPGEPGMGGVTVTLYGPGPDGEIGGGDDVTVATTTTNPDGSYLFSGLADGNYYVQVTDGTGTPLENYTITAGAQSVGSNTTELISLDEGDIYLNADFGYHPPASANNTIGDLVWFDIDGDGVYEPDGADGNAATTYDNEYGFDGVTVALIQDLNGDGDWDPNEPIIAATTGDGGLYEFTGVPDGDYIVHVTDYDDVLELLAQTYDSDDPDGEPFDTPDESRVDDLGVDQPEGDLNDLQDFGYRSAFIESGGLIGDYVWLDLNGDGVQDPDEEPLSGVQVNLYDSQNNLIGSTLTNDGGYYFFPNLGTKVNGEDYTVEIDDDNYLAGGPLEGLEPTYERDGTLDGETPSTLYNSSGGGGKTGPTDLDVDFGFKYTGGNWKIGDTVWYDDNENGAQEGPEDGIEGVTLELRDSAGNIIATATTDADGKYLFEHLPNGDYTVVITDENNRLKGLRNTYGGDLQQVTIADGDELDVDFGYYADAVPPTAVDLLYFTATGAKRAIVLHWETATELDNLGYNLYRAASLSGERTRVNETLIPTNVPPGTNEGALYEYVDRGKPLKKRTTFTYWLEDVDIYGVRTLHGPVSATVK